MLVSAIDVQRGLALLLTTVEHMKHDMRASLMPKWTLTPAFPIWFARFVFGPDRTHGGQAEPSER